MSEWQLVLSIIGVLLAFLGLLWKIIGGVMASLKTIDDKVDRRHDENLRLADTRLSMLQAIQNQILTKPDFKDVNETFAKKEVVALQFELVNHKLNDIEDMLKNKE